MKVGSGSRSSAQASTHSRAFSLLELTVALVVFGVISAIITVSVGRAAVISAELRINRSLEVALASLTDRVASVSFSDLVEDTYPRPDACETQPLESCIRVLERNYTVTWQRELGLVPGSSSIGSVTVTASTLAVGGETTTSSRTVTAPVSGWDTDNGYLTVTLLGEPWAQSVYLLDKDGSVVGVGQDDGNGSALISAKASRCSNEFPCRLALTPEGDLRMEGLSLSPGSVLGVDGEVVLRAGASASLTALVYEESSLTVRLVAQNPDGTGGSPTQLGSVCLWLSFDDGLSERSLGACNSASASEITWGSYLAGNGKRTKVGLPQGNYTISATGPQGTCPKISGQKVFTNNQWVAGSDCSSNTWGPIAALRVAGEEVGAQDSVEIATPGPTTLDAVWTYRAAAGLEGEPTWSWPLDSGACRSSASCAPQPAPTCAAAEHCQSTAKVAPWLTSPREGQWRLPLVVQQEQKAPIVLEFNSTGGRVDVRLSGAPQGQISMAGRANILQGETLGRVSPGEGLELSFDRGTLERGSFTLRLIGADGTERQQVVNVISRPGAYSLQAHDVTVAQGESGSVITRVLGTDGNPLAGAALSLVNPFTGLSVTGPATDATGTAIVSVQAAEAALADDYETKMRATAGTGPSATTADEDITVTVAQSAGEVIVLDSTVAQGSKGTVTVQVSDGAGQPAEDLLVSVAVMDGEDLASGIRATGGCYTSAAGSCPVPVFVDKVTVSGTYQALARAGQVVGTGQLTVSSGPGRILATGQVSVAQGSETTVAVTVVNGEGEGDSGRSITAVPDRGLTTEVSGPTNSLGQATITITAAQSARSGAHTITVTAGDISDTIQVSVRGVPFGVESEEVVIPQGTAGTVSITVVDKGGNPVADALVRLGPTSGLYHPETITTGVDGTADVPVQVDRDSSLGERAISVRDQYTADLGLVPVTVIAGVGTVQILDPATVGEATEVRVKVTDTSGVGVGGLTVYLSLGTPQLFAADTTVVTEEDGIATFTITPRAGTPSGVRDVMASVLGQNYPLKLTLERP